MSHASGPGPCWLLLTLGMGFVSGSGCPTSCQCQTQEVICLGAGLSEYPRDLPLSTRWLTLAHNSLTFLPALDLGLLSDLVSLDCSHNRLREVLDYTFVGVSRLLYLDLSCNVLAVVAPGAFSPLAGLLQLNLSHNLQLRALPRLAFANASALQLLDLRHTGLHSLDHAALSGLPTLRTLYLSGNPWRCNCSLLDFTIYLLGAHLSHPDAQEATCAEPAELVGWPLAQAGHPLRYMCLTHLDVQDYLFLLFIGFCIFAGGTVAAWLTGMCAVLSQTARRRAEDTEDEDEHGQHLQGAGRVLHSRVQAGQDGFPQLV
ncbi:leucine-rich repeat-containing protein 52 [Erinaceus europaeus]|uniref:Leucine-rich repeat-containing protein 52 n=1 Tax=Erinaceus europaeus TaxID=9365 RepID=A0A1S3AHW8_ERIEU|nr:leucine-rich repeat-containing protein 52 [Erinaceus europaeus]